MVDGRISTVTNYLYANPSFLSGAARALDMGGVFDDYNVSATPTEADARALYSDWLATARDLADAARIVELELVPQNG